MKIIAIAVLLVVVVEAHVYHPCEATLPCPGDPTTSSQDMAAWICDQINWRCTLYKWMQKFRSWWSEQYNSAGQILYREPQCPSYELFMCSSGMQYCQSDAFGCTLCLCDGGKFRDSKGIRGFWRREREIYQAIMDKYDQCASEEGCDDIGTTAIPTVNGTATTGHMSPTSPTGTGTATTGPMSPSLTTPEGSGISGSGSGSGQGSN